MAKDPPDEEIVPVREDDIEQENDSPIELPGDLDRGDVNHDIDHHDRDDSIEEERDEHVPPVF